mgnify:CR=1 FL=1
MNIKEQFLKSRESNKTIQYISYMIKKVMYAKEIMNFNRSVADRKSGKSELIYEKLKQFKGKYNEYIFCSI